MSSKALYAGDVEELLCSWSDPCEPVQIRGIRGSAVAESRQPSADSRQGAQPGSARSSASRMRRACEPSQ